MPDVFSKLQRSNVMRAVKSQRNKSTELRLLAFFKECRITGWRRNYVLLGRPDFVFPTRRLAVFVDGCFWHGHPCRNISPDTNSDYWKTKIARNRKRDRLVSQALTMKGWRVVRIRECELKRKARPQLIRIWERNL